VLSQKRTFSVEEAAAFRFQESVVLHDTLRLLTAGTVAQLHTHVQVCHSVRNDLEAEEHFPDSLVSLLMRPCYKFSKLAKQKFFDDPHFSFLFIMFCERGSLFVERKAQESADSDLYLRIIEEMRQQAVNSLERVVEESGSFKDLLQAVHYVIQSA